MKLGRIKLIWHGRFIDFKRTWFPADFKFRPAFRGQPLFWSWYFGLFEIRVLTNIHIKGNHNERRRLKGELKRLMKRV